MPIASSTASWPWRCGKVLRVATENVHPCRAREQSTLQNFALRLSRDDDWDVRFLPGDLTACGDLVTIHNDTHRPLRLCQHDLDTKLTRSVPCHQDDLVADVPRAVVVSVRAASGVDGRSNQYLFEACRVEEATHLLR